MTDKYADYVEHPRYGRGPRRTGLNPQATPDGRIFLHWHSPAECRIPDTAVVADVDRQHWSTVPVSHYYDVRRVCRDCGRPFLFFAEEQRHWYETLQFSLNADCVRCVECRATLRETSHLRVKYEELATADRRTEAQTLELVDAAVTLVERDEFGPRVLGRARHWLGEIAPDSDYRRHATFRRLSERLARVWFG